MHIHPDDLITAGEVGAAAGAVLVTMLIFLLLLEMV